MVDVGGCVARSALGQDVDVGKTPLRPEEHCQHRHEQDCGRDQRQRDPPRDLPFARAIKPRRLEVTAVHARDRRRKNQCRKTDEFPTGDEDNRPDRPAFVAQEVDRLELERPKQPNVDDALNRAEQPTPDDRHDHRSHDHRHEDQGTVDVAGATLNALGQDGDCQRQEHRQRDQTKNVNHGVRERLSDLGQLEQAGVVLPTDENFWRARQQVPFKERNLERLRHGQVDPDDDAQQRGQQVQVRHESHRHRFATAVKARGELAGDHAELQTSGLDDHFGNRPEARSCASRISFSGSSLPKTL